MTHRGYIGQVLEVRPILAAMERRGMPIDNNARLALGEEFARAQAELGKELAARAPDACRRLHPKEGYKGVPPEVKAAQQHADEADGRGVYGLTFKDSGEDGETYRYEQREFSVPDVDAATGEPVARATTRWCRVYDFNPNSRPQVIAYMKAKGHPVPKDKHRENAEGDSPETTNAKELQRLAVRTGDDFYLKVIEYRGLEKMRGTYVDGFVPAADGCVHTSFTFDTGIGQLSSRNPNIQNFPKLKPTPVLAKAMRRMVAARPGHVLTEWDFKSCHIITLGFLAEDLQYMRLGRLDMHSFVAGHFLKLWDGAAIVHESDEELRARFKWLKSDPERKRVRDDQAKHGILGIGNGLKAKGLYERYMENFPARDCLQCHRSGRVASLRGTRKCPACKGTGQQSGQSIADEVLAIAELLFPKVFLWQKKIQRLAHDQQFLKTEFGHIRRFYEVFRWDPRRGDWGHGDQAEEAIAFWLANIAFGHIREKLKELAAEGLDEKYGLFNNVHDSFMFHFPEEMLEEHAREVYPVLVRPSQVLRHPTIAPQGLVIDVEGAWGRCWADMEPIEAPVAAHTVPALPA